MDRQKQLSAEIIEGVYSGLAKRGIEGSSDGPTPEVIDGEVTFTDFEYRNELAPESDVADEPEPSPDSDLTAPEHEPILSKGVNLNRLLKDIPYMVDYLSRVALIGTELGYRKVASRIGRIVRGR